MIDSGPIWNDVTTLKAEVAALAEANKRLNEDNKRISGDCSELRRREIELTGEANAARTERDAYKNTDKGLRAEIEQGKVDLKLTAEVAAGYCDKVKAERDELAGALGEGWI